MIRNYILPLWRKQPIAITRTRTTETLNSVTRSTIQRVLAPSSCGSAPPCTFSTAINSCHKCPIHSTRRTNSSSLIALTTSVGRVPLAASEPSTTLLRNSSISSVATPYRRYHHRRLHTTRCILSSEQQPTHPSHPSQHESHVTVKDPTCVSHAATCWRCHHPLDQTSSSSSSSTAANPSSTTSSSPLFCPSCHTLQESAIDKKRSYYDVFQIPLTYNISLPTLDASYKKLQKSLHPDRFHGGDHHKRSTSSDHHQHHHHKKRLDDQYAIAHTLSSYVNHAYTTLKQPYDRALYLLSLHGLELSESTDTVTDPELLMEIMEIREELESVDDLPSLNRLAAANHAALASLYSQIHAAFQSGDMATMRQLTIKLSYLQNIETEIYRKMPVK